MKNIGVYAGSFDLPTLGHAYVIKEASNLFDRLIVAIGINPDKVYTFSLTDRLMVLNDIAKRAGGNIEVTHYTNQFLAKYVHKMRRDAEAYCADEVYYIVRGIRNPDDAKAELAMLRVNNDPNMVPRPIPHVYFPPPPELAHISSSLVKGLCGSEGWQDLVRPLVPPLAFECLVKWKEHHE